MKSRGCPSRADLLDFFLETAAGGKRREILDHVRSCPDCAAVVEAIRELQSEEDAILGDPARIEIPEETKERLRERARAEIRLLRRHRRRKARSGLRWIAIPAAGAALTLLLVFAISRKGDLGRWETERRAQPEKIFQLRPNGRLAPGTRVFAWSRSDDVRACRLAVYDRNLDLVFRSEAEAADRVELPEPVAAGLKKGEVYFWKIIGTLEDGQTVESEFVRIIP